ncbi:MAG: hypothetical protein KatS3mg114_1059 [Planctomycetaceae bacterium]|nr:MAG: hypothetical protein KatS3mg114_1059 [Planctomycetaceae bacterium]
MQTRLRWGVLFLLMGLCWIGSVSQTMSLQAQDEQAATDTETQTDAAPADAGVDDELERLRNETYLEWMIRASGIFGFLILLVSFIMVALISMNALQLRRENYIPAQLVESFERLINERNFSAAYETAKGSNSFLGKVLAAGMARLQRGMDDALQGMQETGDEETMVMEQSIGYLALIGSIAPMLGLLGTVQGMVASFKVIATSATQPKPYELANGISTALFTTLEGLVVAIPAIVCYTFFKNRLARFTLECGILAEELLKRLLAASRGSAAPRPAAANAPTTPSAPAS